MRNYKVIAVCLLLADVLGCSPRLDIYLSCRQNDLKTLARIVSANPKLVDTQEDAQRWTPLHFSIDSGHGDITQYLLEHGASVNLATKSGETPLHFAAHRLNAEAVRQLLNAGADVNAQALTPGHETPLDMAVLGRANLLEGRQIPLESIKHYTPRTPEELSAEDARVERVIQLLISHGGRQAVTNEVVGVTLAT